MKVTKAVIPAAGLGTRFLPVTKAVPKEMMPVLDKPPLHYIAEEAVLSGAKDVLIVVNEEKNQIHTQIIKCRTIGDFTFPILGSSLVVIFAISH